MKNNFLLILIAVMGLSLASCSTLSHDTPPPAASYSIGDGWPPTAPADLSAEETVENSQAENK